jgi:hypothetical protein
MSTKDRLFLENELVGNVFILCKPFFFNSTWPAMAQAVSCWLLWGSMLFHVEFVMDKMALGQRTDMHDD